MGRVDSMKAVGREIKGSYDERLAAVSSIRREAADYTAEIQMEHREMATQLREDLSKARSVLSTDVSIMEQEMKREHRETGTQLRKDLSKIRPALRQDVSGLLKSYRNMITGIKKDHQEVVNAWHDLVATMQSKRSGAPAAARR